MKCGFGMRSSSSTWLRSTITGSTMAWLSQVTWSRGAYSIAELESRYLQNRQRASLILHQFQEIHGDPLQARALGFCVSIAHASSWRTISRRTEFPPWLSPALPAMPSAMEPSAAWSAER